MKVWDFKIVVSDDAKLPITFDQPPRAAAIDAVEKYGIEVIACFSGWGGTLTEMEAKITDNHIKRRQDEIKQKPPE